MTQQGFKHRPVLIDEVMASLQPQGADVYIDCTFGRGGYSQRILDALGDEGRVLALDADPDAIAYGEEVFKGEPRLLLRHTFYDSIADVVKTLSVPAKIPDRVDGIVFDLGVSSPQLDDASRGFSFRFNGPLDMRMNPSVGQSAADWVNTAEHGEMARVFSRLGEEQLAGKIASHIVRARQQAEIKTTAVLADIVFQAFPEKERRKRKIHPATKVFQAIRMHINDELGHLQRALVNALDVLAINGVLAVVSFHSLEDRMVKRFFRHCVEGEVVPDGLPLTHDQMGGDFEYVAKQIKPSAEEIEINPRSRSARLRAIRRLR